MDMNMRISGELLNKQDGVKLRMLADFKKMKAGKIYSVKDPDLTEWLLSRKYAEFAG